MAKQDLLTFGYNVSGEAFRSSPLGAALKFSITNPASKAIRDLALSKTPEHYKRFAQYLSGGTRGDITKLPKEIIQDIAIAKFQGQHDAKTGIINTYDDHFLLKHKERAKTLAKKASETGNWKDYNALINDKKNYSKGRVETYGSIGHGHLKDNKDGTHTLKDIYDVDHEKDYKPLRGTHFDLQEGTISHKGKEYPVASRLYDASKWLGFTGDFKYNVKIKNKDLKINKKTKGQ